MMYTRNPDDPHAAPDVPHGYGGNAFREEEHAKQLEEDIPVSNHAVPPRHEKRPPPRRPWFALPDFRHFDLHSFLSGDLLLIAVALLLVTGRDDDCEEEDHDLWLLLLLLYFMK